MVKKLLVVMVLLVANTTTSECADLPSKENLVGFFREALVNILITPCGLLLLRLLLHLLLTHYSSLNSLLLELLHLLLPVLVPTLSVNTELPLPLLNISDLSLISLRLLPIFLSHSQNLLLSLLWLKELNLATLHNSVNVPRKNADTPSAESALSLTLLKSLFSFLRFSNS